MLKDVKLTANTRSKEDGANTLRPAGLVPGNMYGSGSVNVNLKIVQNEIERAYERAGESNLIDLSIDESDGVKVIIKEVQIDPVRDKIIHVDFYKVDMKKPIEIEIPLRFIGEVPIIKESGGTLVSSLNSIQAKCLPGDLIEGIDVDLSVLENYSSSIKVGDIKIPENIELLSNVEDIVASAVEVKEEVEEVPETEGEDGAEGEGEEKKEGAEGEAQEKKESKSEEKKETEDKK